MSHPNSVINEPDMARSAKEIMPQKEYQLSRFLEVTDPFDDPVTGLQTRVIFATRTGTWMAISQSEWSDIQSYTLHQIKPALFERLLEFEIIVPSEEDELSTILQRNRRAIADNRDFYLVVQPTDSCQLGCDYCGQSHGRQQMSPEHQDAIASRAEAKLRSGAFDSIRVAWFGAEPLAALGVIRRLGHKLIDIAKNYNCKYSSLVVTNGLLLSTEVATELIADLHVSLIEVTLDGTPEYHDSRRSFKTGLQSFQKIYENVRALARRDDLKLDLRVRCNVDSRNRDGVLPLVELLAADGLAEKLSFYVAPIHSWGNTADSLLDPLEFASWQIEWFAHAVRLGFKPKLIPGRIESVCMAVQEHAELVDASGSMFNCTEVSYVPTYEGARGRDFAASALLPIIGQSVQDIHNIYSVGSVDTQEIPGKRKILGDFNDRVARGEYPCAECTLLPTCGGRCPKLWLEGLKPCPPEKHNIRQRLMLAYLLSSKAMTIEAVKCL